MATRRDRLGESSPEEIAASFFQAAPERWPEGAPMPVPNGDGMLVTMYGIDGLTDPEVLDSPFHFQCPPMDSLSIDESFSFSTWNTLRHGDMTSPTGRSLSSVSFTTLWLDYRPSFSVHGDYAYQGAQTPDPTTAARRLKAILRRGTPFGLVIGNRKLWDRNDLHWGPTNGNAAVLTSLGAEERAGELDARYFNVTFQEYREPKLLRRVKGKPRPTSDTRGRKLPAVVVVDRAGTARDRDRVVLRDASLRGLAKHYYGEQAAWRLIAQANGITGFAPSRNLGEYVKAKREKTRKVRIPKPVEASVNRPGAGGREVGD